MNYTEFEQALAAMDQRDLETAIAVLGAMIFGILIIALIWYLLASIGRFKMLKKAGEAGWKGFIPIYNRYMLYKISWKPAMFAVYFVAAIITPFIGNPENTILSIISLALSIVIIVVTVKMCLYTAKAFGRGVGTGVLLIFFPFIMYLVLGFGKAQYIGNTTTGFTPVR